MGSAIGEAGVTLLAAEEGGTSNFLIPNGTFFFVLAIFLVVLGVIGKFVVPPIQKVLGERERMLVKTAEDNKRAVELEAAAEADYRGELAGKSRRSEKWVFEVTDSVGVLEAMDRLTEQMDKKLDEILRAQLEAGK